MTTPTPERLAELRKLAEAGLRTRELWQGREEWLTLSVRARQLAQGVLALLDALAAAEDRAEAVAAWIEPYSWLAEGRGPYAYDDGRFDDDVHTFVRGLLERMQPGRWEPFQTVLKQRDTLQAELTAARGLLDRRFPETIEFNGRKFLAVEITDAALAGKGEG